MEEEKAGLIATYKQLINVDLPATFTHPIRLNHCFARVVLDWLFKDCWYNHLSKKQTAISQLSTQQLLLAIERMQQWLNDPQLLITDNNQSLQYRKAFRTMKR